MTVKYEAYTWLGQKVCGLLDAKSEDEARSTLERDGLIPYRLVETHRRKSLVELYPALFRPKDQALIDFTRQLAALLQAGIPTREAVTALRSECRNLGLKEALRQIVEDIEEGNPLSVACSRHPMVFPGFFVNLLRIGEAAGETSTVLQKLGETLERRKSVRDKVRGALVYPVLSIIMVIVAGFVLMTYSVPALLKLLEEFGGELPTATMVLVVVSRFCQTYIIYIAAVSAAVAVGTWSYTRTARGALLRDRLILKLPAVGTVIRASSMFSLTSILGTLLRGGVPLVEALRLGKEAVGNSAVRGGVDSVAERASGGMRLSRAFRDQPSFSPLLAQGIATGETAGNLLDVLDNLAVYFEKEMNRAISGATELIQPLVILVVAGLVGFVAVAVISGIYSTLSSIK